MTRTITRLALAALLAAPAALTAQTPTPEGTQIKNKATVTWRDENNNTYTPVSDSVIVTVGYAVNIDVSVLSAIATPASPSTGNQYRFTIANGGNGTDKFSVSTTAAAGVTITGYLWGTGTYATLADLNTDLAADSAALAQGATTTVDVVYTVASGQGGAQIAMSLTATSLRLPTEALGAETETVSIRPAVAAAVTVNDLPTTQRVPTSGAITYSASFTVSNNGNASDTYSLAAAAGAAGTPFLTIVSVNGTSGSSGTATIASGGSASVSVVYTVAAVAAGSTQDLTLTATSGNTATVSDAGTVTIEVVRPALTITKAAFRVSDGSAIGATDLVLPGEAIDYRITITNTGGAPARNISIADPLSAELTLVSTTGDAADWTVSANGAGITAALPAATTLAAGASRYITVRATVK